MKYLTTMRSYEPAWMRRRISFDDLIAEADAWITMIELADEVDPDAWDQCVG